MDIYRGPVTILTSGGLRVGDGRANLSKSRPAGGGQEESAGIVFDVDLSGHLGELVTVRLPDGHEGQALVTHLDEAHPESGARVVGTGPAPF